MQKWVYALPLLALAWGHQAKAADIEAGKAKAAVMRRVNRFLRGRKSDMIHLIEQNSSFQPPCNPTSTSCSA